MTPRPLLYFLLLFALFWLTSCEDAPVFKRGSSLLKIGDDPSWASKELDTSDWKKRIKLTDGRVYWSRTKVKIFEAPEALRPYGIRPHVYGEYEVFWDGVLIGKSGNPGREEELGPEGKMWLAFSIPTELTNEGIHTIAIRSSLYYFPDHEGVYGLDLDYYDNLLTNDLIETAYMHLFAGAFLIASVYFLFLYFSNKKEYPTLVFSISCFLFFMLNLAEFIHSYVSIHYSLHHIRLELIGIFMLGISFSIPLYFALQYPFPKRKRWLILYSAVLLFIFFIKRDFFFLTARNMGYTMLVFSMGIVLYAVYKRRKGALLVMFTLPMAVLIGLATSFKISLFAGFSLVLLGMLYLLTMRLKEQRLAYENSLVQSTRLSMELLKKNIQPHFLLNTLTSLIDWIEEAPKKGVLFIEALAKEFDLINQIEKETLIPITQEITLCRTHLEVMEYRKEIKYYWEEEGIDPDQKIPPAVIHTLLENGITHSLPLEDNSVRFKLQYKSVNEYQFYTFLTYASGVKQGESREEGTGLKYIKARLTESYQSRWDLISEPAEHGWKNQIKIYH